MKVPKNSWISVQYKGSGKKKHAKQYREALRQTNWTSDSKD